MQHTLTSRYRLPALLSLAVGVAGLAFAQQPALDLSGALERARERSPAIADSRAELAIAAAEFRRARRWANPELAVETENVLGSGPFSDFDAAETTVALSQQIPLGAQQSTGRTAAGIALELAQLQLLQAGAQTERDVTIAYAEAVMAERLAALERQRASAATAVLDAVVRRHAAGLESDLQLSRGQVEAIRAQNEARRAQLEVASRHQALARSWGDSELTEALDGGWFERLSEHAETDTTPTAVRLRAAQLAASAAAAQLQAERAARLPMLTATLGARRFEGEPADANRALMLGFSVPLPLWDRNQVGIARASAEAQRRQREADQMAPTLAAETTAAQAKLRMALAEARVLEAEAMPAAARAQLLAEQGYEAGRLSLLERIAIESDAYQTAEALERARLAAHLAGAELTLLAAGLSLPASDRNAPRARN